ncbi:MAG: SDR family oxidoreductase [Holophagales bacterium]|nr:SDR family oxidoreductase [Holophagales bacterium]MYH27104.1 SDR family oxidoreductase [Holophagales bacterium]
MIRRRASLADSPRGPSPPALKAGGVGDEGARDVDSASQHSTAKGRDDLADKVAIVTGGGSGIGRAVTHGLVEDGYHVLIAGRREDRLVETKSGARDSGKVSVVAADISTVEGVQAVFDRLTSAFGRLDLLFNNAGTGASPVPIEDLTLEQWNRVVGVNLTGAFLCTQRAVRLMKEQDPQGGRIINNGSISAHVPRPNSAPYTATKHAITGLTRSTSLDGRRFNIACGQIDIGNAYTRMTARMSEGVAQPDGRTMPEPTIDVRAVVDAVRYMAALPLDANVPFLTVMANEMPFMGRG